ncbi:hypothetical protein RAA17_23175 [Komagataeibacter rhaeticus]|nr:hypothetical protein [Komagataeibacter rhaeticus]
MSMRICASSSPGEVRIAVTDNGRLCDFALWRPDMADGVGDLYRARVSAHVPALGAPSLPCRVWNRPGSCPIRKGLAPYAGAGGPGSRDPQRTGRQGCAAGCAQPAPDLPGGSEPGLLRRGPTLWSGWHGLAPMRPSPLMTRPLPPRCLWTFIPGSCASAPHSTPICAPRWMRWKTRSCNCRAA